MVVSYNHYQYVDSNPVNIRDWYGLHTGGYGGPEKGDEMASGDISEGPKDSNDSHSGFYDKYDVYGYGKSGYYGEISSVINQTFAREVVDMLLTFLLPSIEERKKMAKQYAAPRLKVLADAYKLNSSLPTNMGGLITDGFQRRRERGTNQCHGHGFTDNK